MKRRDWKIKKLKKDIYDKFNKKIKIYFLRKLYLRRNLVLGKKNLIPHFFYFKKIYDSSKNLKRFRFIIQKLNNNTIILPNFFYSKKIFNKIILYKFFFKSFDINSVFLNIFEKNFKKNSYVFGNNIALYFNNNEKKTLFFKNLLSEDNKFLINFKQNELDSKLIEKENFNFLFNYNVYYLNIAEIYKILIILQININFIKK